MVPPRSGPGPSGRAVQPRDPVLQRLGRPSGPVRGVHALLQVRGPEQRRCDVQRRPHVRDRRGDGEGSGEGGGMVRHRRIARRAELAEGDRPPLPARRRRGQGRGPGRQDAFMLGGARRPRVHADAGDDVLLRHRGGEGSRLCQKTIQRRGRVVGSPGHFHARVDVPHRRGHRSRRAPGHRADQAVRRDRMSRGGRVPGRPGAIIRSTACP